MGWEGQFVNCCTLSVLTDLTSNLRKAHETRDSHSSSCLLIVGVYLQPFCRNSFFKCALQPKIAKQHLNPLFWRIQGHLRSSMSILLKARHQCLLWQAACLCLSATVFPSKRANIDKNNQFLKGYPYLTLACAGLIEPKRLGFKTTIIHVWCWKFHVQVVLVYL